MAKQDPSVQLVNDFLAKAEKTHNEFEKRVEEYYDVYRGKLDTNSEAAQYKTNMHPPYLNQVVETITNSLVDTSFQFKVKPRPKAVPDTEWEALLGAASTLERLLAYELEMDKFNEKQRPFILQGLIAPFTVGKTYWRSVKGQKRTLGVQYASDPQGNVSQVLDEVSSSGYLVDGPCFEVVDVRDFFWPESARSLDEAPAVVHRMYKTYDELLALQEMGVYSNVSNLKDSEGQSNPKGGREQTYNHAERARDRIEIYEYWQNDRVIVVGGSGRNVLLADAPNPFWHAQKPFVVASALPDLFQIPGISMIELVQHLQKMLWTLINQRIDSLRLLANPVLLVRSDLDDTEQIVFEPGAVIEVESPEQVQVLNVPEALPQMTIEAENLIKGELQNLTGGALFMAGANSAPVDQTTATGVSIISSLAQKQMLARQQNFKMAFSRIGHQFASMLQQFVRDERAYMVVGKGADLSLLKVSPMQLQGEFDVSIEPSTESSIRQERRAEAQALLQVSAEVAAPMAMSGTPINLKAVYERFLDAYDILDKDAFFSSHPPPGLGAPPGAPPPGQAPPQGAPPQGVTSPTAIAPTSPSNPTSISPAMPMQRFLAGQGGVNNGGGQ